MRKDPTSHGLFKELKRREVFSTAAYYVAAAWGGIEILEWVLERWQIAPPDWLMPLLAAALVVGFPVAMFLAWMFDLDRTGIHRTAPMSRRGGLTMILALLLMVGGTGGLYYLIGSPEAPKIVLPPTIHPKLAVLPLESFGSGPQQAEFADAIHYELISNLANIDSLRVISRQSVMEYRDSTKSLPEIALELDVDALLTGIVQRVGERARISLSLRDGGSDQQVWSDEFSFNFTPENFFEIQSEVAGIISKKFHLALTGTDRIRIGTAPTRELTAYDLFLLGRLKSGGTVADTEEAVELLQEAIRIDPEFAPAYVGLATAYNSLRGLGSLPFEEWVELAEALVAKALDLDDKLGEAWQALGWLRYRQGRVDEAEEAYRRALELRPNSADLYAVYGSFLYIARNLSAEAEVWQRKALELNPRSGGLYTRLAWTLEDQGRVEEARASMLKVHELEGTEPDADWFLGLIDVFGRADYASGIRSFEQAAKVDEQSPLVPGFLTFAYLDLLDFPAAESWAAEAWRRAPNKWMSCATRVMLALYRREVELELPCLKTMLIEDHRGSLALLLMRNLDLRVGQHTAALERYRKFSPELFGPDGPAVNKNNLQRAIDLCLVLREDGQDELAGALLEKAMVVIGKRPRLSSGGYGWADVEVLALQGRTREALAAMRVAIDEGLRTGWWELEQRRNLRSLQAEPEFKAMLAELRSDMLERRDRIRQRRLPEQSGVQDRPEPAAASH